MIFRSKQPPVTFCIPKVKPPPIQRITLLALLSFALLFSGCQFSGTATENYNSEYAIAVVKSNDSNISTFIEYYDKDLNQVNKLEYPYSTLENTWGKPERSGDEVFLAAQGIGGLRNSPIVVGLDTKTGAVHEYDTGMTVLKNSTANERYVFASNFLNGKAKLVRIDKAT